MTDDKLEFCTTCGAKIGPDDEYCPACGTLLEYERSRTVEGYEWNTKHERPLPNYINAIVVMCVIYFFFALYFGCSMAFGVDTMIDAIKDEPDLWAQLMDVMSEDAVRSMITSIGLVFIVSGCLALVSGILTYLNRYNTLAIITCVLSSILGMIMIIGVVGLIVTYFIVKSKPFFTD